MFDIFKNLDVDTLDQVPAEWQGLYVEKDDKSGFKVNDKHPIFVSLSGIHGTLKKQRKDMDDLKTKYKNVDLSALKDYGEDVEAIAAGIQAKLQSEREEGAKSKGADVEKIKGALAQQHSKGVDGYKSREKALRLTVEDLLVTQQASTGLMGHKGDPLLMPHVVKQIKVVEEDGKFRAMVVDTEGSQRYDGTGQPMSIPGLISEMKGDKQFARFFESAAEGGGGKAAIQQRQTGATQGAQ